MGNLDQRILNFVQRTSAPRWKLLSNRHLANICMWLCCLKHAVHVNPTLNWIPNILVRKKLQPICFYANWLFHFCLFFAQFNEEKMQNSFQYTHEVNNGETFWLCSTWIFIKIPSGKTSDRSKCVDQFEFQRESSFRPAWYQKQTSLLSSF